MNVPIYIIVISNYIFSLLNCLYEIYNTVITTKQEEEEVNDTIYIYIVCRRGDASVCQTRQSSYNIYIMINIYLVQSRKEIIIFYFFKKKLLLKMHK